MRVTVRLLGVEILTVDIDRPQLAASPPGEGDGREVFRHAGDFGFGPLPGPTWRPLPSDVDTRTRRPPIGLPDSGGAAAAPAPSLKAAIGDTGEPG